MSNKLVSRIINNLAIGILILVGALLIFVFSWPLFLSWILFWPLVVVLVAIVLTYSLRLAFRLIHVPNYTTAFPSGLISWRNLAPPDILFRLTSLAILNLVLYWLPIYYWTTYTPSGDERDGGVLFPALVFCPVSWVLGVLCYAQIWRAHRTISPHHKTAFCIISSLLLLAILSTVIPQVRFYIGMSHFLLMKSPPNSTP